MENSVDNNVLTKQTVGVLDSVMHYVTCGRGDPIVFLHGIPTSSYLWRYVMPEFKDHGYCIAPDLIGMGESGKPNINYTIQDHILYMEGFIKRLDLTNITLVVHGWGSVIGCDIARRMPERFKQFVFYESHLRPTVDWDMLSLPIQQIIDGLRQDDLRDEHMLENNHFVRALLKKGCIYHRSDEELTTYCLPFKTPSDRKPILQYFNELPLGSGPQEVVSLIQAYSDWLTKCEHPKCVLYCVPGFMTTMDAVIWARDHLKNVTCIDLDEGMHYVQESHPDSFVQAVITWMNSH